MRSTPGTAGSAGGTGGAAWPGWLALTATQRGASHDAAGQPNQDAVITQPIPAPRSASPADPAGLVAAVADGHGHVRHFRSARGSQLAVTAACQQALDVIGQFSSGIGRSQLETKISQLMVPAIVDRWRAAVADDLAAEPFTPEEETLRGAGDGPLIAYGSTLLLAVVWRQWLLLAQIGDGDIVAIAPGGGVLQPVPDDPSLDGQQTTSLCGPRAVAEFRVAAMDTGQTDLLAVMLATDGYGNAQAADPWAPGFARDLAALLAAQGPEWVAGQLPGWAARCASAEGSGDDTTIALLVNPAGTAPGPSLADTDPGLAAVVQAEPRTRPTLAATGTDTAPAGSPSGPASSGPAPATPVPGAPGSSAGGAAGPGWPRGRLITVVVAAVVLLGAAIGFIALLGSGPGSRTVACRVPSASSSQDGRVVHGRVITTCDAATGRAGSVSTRGLPAGPEIEVQRDGSVFVLVAGHGLFRTADQAEQANRDTTGHSSRWHELAPVAGGTPRLCVAGGDVVAASDLEADAPTSSPASPRWSQLQVDPSQEPPAVVSRQRLAHPLCPAGPGR